MSKHVFTYKNTCFLRKNIFVYINSVYIVILEVLSTDAFEMHHLKWLFERNSSGYSLIVIFLQV